MSRPAGPDDGPEVATVRFLTNEYTVTYPGGNRASHHDHDRRLSSGIYQVYDTMIINFLGFPDEPESESLS
jgi:hypothetical protein